MPVILLLLALFGVSSAFAQGGGTSVFDRASRMEKSEKKETGIDLQKERKFPGTFKVKTKPQAKEQPSVDVDQYRRQKTKLIYARRQKAIKDSEHILARTRDRALRANIELVLANLYMENYDYFRLQEQEQYNQAWKRYAGKGRKPELDDRKSKAYRVRALKIYRGLYQNDKSHPSRDEILYFLGYLEFSEGNEKGSLPYFNELMSRYPRSRLVPEAELKVGDYYFKQDVETALGYYKRLANRHHSLSIYARYKMAWCYYNQKNFDLAIENFKSVVAQSQEEKGKRGAFDLSSEALNDLVVAFAEADRADEARDYFSKVGGEQYYLDLLQKLGDIYYTSGKLDASIRIYRELQQLKPMHIKAPNWQQNIIEAFKTIGNERSALSAMEEYAVRYQKDGEWAKANYDRPDDVEEAINSGEFGLRKSTKEAHFLAQKSHAKNDYAEAINLYQVYMKHYSEVEAAYEMRFYFAEALYQVGEFKRAGVLYGKVARAGEKKRFYVDATYGGIVAFLAEMEKGAKTKPAPKNTRADLKEVPLEDFQQEFIELVNFFVKDKPSDSRALDLMYRSAYLCYDRNHIKCAEERFNWVIKNHPTSEKAQYSAHLMLHWLEIEEKYTELANLAETFYTNPKLGDAKFKAEMKDIMSKSRFKAVEIIEKSGNRAQAAAGYAKLGMSEKDPKIADKALYKAAENFLAIKDDESARKYYNVLVEKYPTSDLAPSAILWIAGFYRDRLQVVRAAKALERFVEIAPKSDKEISNARYDIGILYEAKQMYPEAEKAFRGYALSESSRADAPLAYRKSCDMILKQRKQLDAVKCLETSKKLWPKRGAEVLYADAEILEIFRKTKNEKAANVGRDRLLNLFRDTDGLPARAKVYLAQARFEDNEGILRQFQAVKLDTFKVQALQKRIREKLALLSKVEKAYNSVLRYGSGDWGVPALYEIGNAYQGFAEGLLNAPKPPGLNAEEIAVYEEELQKPAADLDEKGRTFFETAYATIKKLGVYNEWSKRVYAKLNVIDPTTYPIQFELGLQPLYVSEFVPED